MDGLLVAEHDFGDIRSKTVEYASISSTVSIESSASYEIRVLIARDYAGAANTPRQYIDNVTVVGSGQPADEASEPETEPAADPTPEPDPVASGLGERDLKKLAIEILGSGSV